MKKITVGLLAHVDSGKTTLSEAMLYTSGNIRKLGRVDHGDSFLDNNPLERERGITIFSKQAQMRLGENVFTILDTPGHVDFSAETERSLAVIDYAILIVSASEGIQSHTETLWKMLRYRGIPTFIFVNKMDLSLYRRSEIIEKLNEKFGVGFCDFTKDEIFSREAYINSLSLCSENLLELALEDASDEEFEPEIKKDILASKLFPVCFGSALKLQGIKEFLETLSVFTDENQFDEGV